MDLINTMNNLSFVRPVFHSENDFQFELAWQLKKENPEIEIRLEKPVSSKYLDLYTVNHNEIIGIELKYKTARLEYNDQKTVDNFNLKDHAAVDLGRFDFINDILRLEQLKIDGEISKGYCIFLTNSPPYWNSINYKYKIPPNDINFRFDEGKTLTGSLKWTQETKETTVGRSRFGGIFLKSNYIAKWRYYSELNLKNGHFRYLLIEV